MTLTLAGYNHLHLVGQRLVLASNSPYVTIYFTDLCVRQLSLHRLFQRYFMSGHS